MEIITAAEARQIVNKNIQLNIAAVLKWFFIMIIQKQEIVSILVMKKKIFSESSDMSFRGAARACGMK